MMNFENMGWGMGSIWIVGLLLLGVLSWFVISSLLKIIADKRELDSSMEALKERHVRGEISKKDYQQILKDLD